VTKQTEKGISFKQNENHIGRKRLVREEGGDCGETDEEKRKKRKEKEEEEKVKGWRMKRRTSPTPRSLIFMSSLSAHSLRSSGWPRRSYATNETAG
jgi:hypothetical protein